MLSALIETYCVHLEAEGRSLKTVESHRACLGRFAAWLHEAGQPENPESWTANTIRTYYVALKRMTKRDGESLSATSINTYARSLRAFCHWLHAEEFVAKHSPVAALMTEGKR